MKRWYVQLLMLLVVSAVLLSINFDIVRGVRYTSHSEIFAWLNLTGAGVGLSLGAMLVLIFMLCADAIWLWILLIWTLRKVFHVKSENNRFTLFLP